MNEWNKVDSHQIHVFVFYTIERNCAFSEMLIIWDDIIMIIVCHVCPLEEVLGVATSLRTHSSARCRVCRAIFFSWSSLMPVAKSCTTLFNP